jgi:hypothetical protein
MNRIFAVAAVLGLAACSQTSEVACGDCAPGMGGLRLALLVSSSSVARVTATVTAPDLATPIVQDLTIAGTPPAATGTIANVPAGGDCLVTLAAYPSAPEAAVVIFRGSATTALQAGLVSSASITLRPVVADVAVSAGFPAGDADVARVHHVAVTVSGDRISGAATWYLALDAGAGTASGTASRVPVGASRTVTVRAYDAAGALLHEGTAATPVVEGAANAVTVSLANAGGPGSISVSGGFCTPDCSSSVCGDDGCGGSCGGCQPGFTCDAGACASPPPPPPTPSQTGTWRTVSSDRAFSGVWASGPDDVWLVGDKALRHWDGAAWSEKTVDGYYEAVWGSGPGDVWAVATEGSGGSFRGIVEHWDGTAWSTSFASDPLRFRAVWGTGKNDVWVMGNGSPDSALHFDGTSWSSVPLGVTWTLVNGIWGSGPNDVWAVGATGLILHWDGTSWANFSVETTTYLWGIWGSGPNDVWAVGNHSATGVGHVLHWDGTAWSTSQLGPDPLYSVWGSAQNDVWAGSGYGSPAWHYDGSGWSPVPLSATASITAMWGLGPNDIWAVGWDSTGLGHGVIWHYSP